VRFEQSLGPSNGVRAGRHALLQESVGPFSRPFRVELRNAEFVIGILPRHRRPMRDPASAVCLTLAHQCEAAGPLPGRFALAPGDTLVSQVCSPRRTTPRVVLRDRLPDIRQHPRPAEDQPEVGQNLPDSLPRQLESGCCWRWAVHSFRGKSPCTTGKARPRSPTQRNANDSPAQSIPVQRLRPHSGDSLGRPAARRKYSGANPG